MRAILVFARMAGSNNEFQQPEVTRRLPQRLLPWPNKRAG